MALLWGYYGKNKEKAQKEKFIVFFSGTFKPNKYFLL
jgi:hypothetical protein